MPRITRVLAAILAAPLIVTPALVTPALAQDGGTSSGGSSSQDAAPEDQGGTGSGGATGMSQMQGEDVRIASVGDTEITGQDVIAAVEALPPQMRQQPPEQLIPMVVEQLVLREMILQAAEAEGVIGEPTEAETQMAQENVTVRAYLEREMEGVVTDEAVQTAYDEATQSIEGEAPPLEEVRPQIEQQLRGQALIRIREELLSTSDVTYYGPDGEPVEEETGSSDGGSSDGGSNGSSSTGGN